jgi:phage-related baseplate assembly protein
MMERSGSENLTELMLGRNQVQEKRRHFRKRISSALEFQVGDGPKMAGVCHDLSLGGIHIQADVTPPFGAQIVVHFQFKGTSAPSALPGVVRWVKPGAIGVQFGSLGARETYAITEMLAGA